jgi:hypothetical protein
MFDLYSSKERESKKKKKEGVAATKEICRGDSFL